MKCRYKWEEWRKTEEGENGGRKEGENGENKRRKMGNGKPFNTYYKMKKSRTTARV